MWNDRKKAYLAALSLSIIVGFSFMASKLTLGVALPLETLAHRFTVSFLVLAGLVVSGTFKIHFTREEVLSILPLSVFYPILFFSLQLYGLQYIASSEAGIIQATVPIMTLILAGIFLKEKLNRRQQLFMVLSFSGVVYISLMKGLGFTNGSFLGIILIAFSALASATSNVLSRKFSRKFGFKKLTTMAIIVGFLFFNLLNLGVHLADGNLTAYFDPLKERTYLLSVLYLGTLSTLGTSLLSNYALSKMEASRISIFNHLGTLITIFAGVVFLHEPLYSYHIIGASFILLGVIGVNYNREHPHRSP